MFKNVHPSGVMSSPCPMTCSSSLPSSPWPSSPLPPEMLPQTKFQSLDWNCSYCLRPSLRGHRGTKVPSSLVFYKPFLHTASSLSSLLVSASYCRLMLPHTWWKMQPWSRPSLPQGWIIWTLTHHCLLPSPLSPFHFPASTKSSVPHATANNCQCLVSHQNIW